MKIYNHPRVYDFLDSLVSGGFSDKAREHALKNIEGKVLEVGIGTAKSAFHISGQLYGVDVSVDMLKRARQKSEDTRLVAADAYHMPFRDDVFDWAIFLFSMRQLNDPRMAIQEGLRVADNIMILDYKLLPERYERMGERIFNAKNIRLDGVVEEFHGSHERFAKLYDIFRIEK